MKLSVSIPIEDVEFLDGYASAHALASRSAAMQRAIRALRLSELGESYDDAWTEWSKGPDVERWERVTADGLQ
jgi:Arc/MetJ-type ribon-helix-helix transcriptional regulator